MKNLTTATVDELRAELERRRAPPMDVPAALMMPDFDQLTEMCVQYRDFVDDDVEWCDDNDFKQHIFESALSAVFGPGFWVWRNKRRP